MRKITLTFTLPDEDCRERRCSFNIEGLYTANMEGLKELPSLLQETERELMRIMHNIPKKE